MNATLKGLIEHIDTLVPPPEAFVRINNALANDPFSAIPRMGSIIEQDPELRARLLQILNSPYFAFPSTIDSIPRALAVLGPRELSDLVLAACTVQVFGRLDNPIVGARRFWQHSLYCAVAARALAEHRREPHTERFFAAGLLHDVGSLVLFRVLPELARECLQQARHTGEDMERVERHRLGFSHSHVGAAIAQRWALPEPLVEAVRWHHAPTHAPRYRFEAGVVHIAEYITHSAHTEPDAIPHGLDPQVWDLTGLTPDIREAVQGELEDKFPTMRRLLFRDVAAA